MSLSSHFFSTLTLGFTLLILLHSSLVLTQTTYYVKYNSTANASATGAIGSPFTSISQAVGTLKAGNFELLLMDNPHYLATNLTLPLNSNYSIRPASLAEGQTYFPVYFNPYTFIAVNRSNLYMQQIQLIDPTTNRGTTNPSLRVWQSALLNLDRVKFADINYTTSFNSFIWADAGVTDFTTVNIVNCEFRNLTNVRWYTIAAKITITNTIFSNIVTSRAAHLYMTKSFNTTHELTFNNVTIQNSNFSAVPSGSTYGFIYMSGSGPSIVLQDFTVKDVYVTNKYPLMILFVTTTGQTAVPRIKGNNVLIQNFYEVPTSDGTTSQLGSFHHVQGNLSLEYTNMTLINVQLIYSAFIQDFQSSTDNTQVFVPNATFQGLAVKNCTNIYIYLKYFNTILFDDVQIQNHNYISPYALIGMISLAESKTALFTNFRIQNHTGPILKTTDVMNPSAKDWTLNDVYTSIRGWTTKYPIFFSRSNGSAVYNAYPDQIGQAVISWDNINFNGYYDVNSLTLTGNDLGAYALGIITEYGKAYLNNTRFYNMKLSVFGGGFTNHIMIDNMTVDSDPSFLNGNIPTHAIFKFSETKEANLLNSKFYNQKSMFIFLMYFQRRSGNNSAVTHPILRFENLTVVNNSVSTVDQNTAYPSLFNIRCPLDPVTASFKNSIFQNNTVLSAVIMTDESIRIDVDYINNTFTDNYAILEGAVIAAKSMRGANSLVNLIGNTFGNNTSLKYGGVLYFLSTQHIIVSQNNIYYNNSAKISGGVGYFSHSQITYTETDGTYFNNSAGSYGGAWFLSLPGQKDEVQAKFTGTTFEASSALRRGAALYIESGNVYLEDTSFKGSWARDAGGDICLVAVALITMQRVNSSASYSPQGSFLYTETTVNKPLKLGNIRVTDISLSDVDTTVLVINSGSVVVSNAVFKDISSPLFSLKSSSATFANTSLSNIQCRTEDATFCIFEGYRSNFSANGLYIDGVTSNQNLFDMKASVDFNVQNFNMGNMKNLGNNILFGLVFNTISNITIQNSKFTQLEFSGIKSQRSNLKIVDSKFSNAIDERFLQEEESSSISSIEASATSQETRFIVLSATNSSITGTDFVANSPSATTLNGGAILITGNPSDHYISGCSFESNTGLNGGAISIESTVNSLNIENSQFINNTATGNGGSIYLPGQGSSVTPVISQATFQRNQALTGGAIYVSNSPLTIQGSVFEGNNADIGAAIVSSSQSSQTVSISGTSFNGNSARAGAALMSLGELNFDMQTNTFADNSAEEGGDIATRPHHLAIKVYHVSETFLYLSNNITNEYILSHYQTVLVYDSRNDSLQNSLAMKPGRYPAYFFEVEVLNELGEDIRLKEMTLELGVSTPVTTALDIVENVISLPNSTSSSDILGTLKYSFNQSTGQIFNSFYIGGKSGDKTLVNFKIDAKDYFSNQTYTLPIFELPVNIAACTVGEVYNPSTSMCKPCSNGSYSFADPKSISTCEDCLSSAVCLGGSVLYPRAGYWRMNETSDNIIKCPYKNACIGGLTDDERNISLTGHCGEGHEGVGCGTCSFGYIRGGLNNECVSCQAAGIRVHMKYIFFFFIRAGMIFFTVGLFVGASYRDEKGKARVFIQVAVIKVIIDFMHMINPILVLHQKWPDQVRDLFDVISSPTAMNRNNFSFDCMITAIRGTNDDIVFIKNAVLLLQPAIFVLFAGIVALTVAKFTKKKIPNLKKNCVVMSLVAAYICQPDIIQSLFTLFRCDNFGSTSEEENFLIEDTSVRCWQSHHAYWVIGVGVPSLVLWLLIPLLVLLRLLWKRKQLTTEAFTKKYDFFLMLYRSQMFHWEILILTIKIILIGASMMRYTPYLQTYLSFIILVIAYLLHKYFEPYANAQINRAQHIGILTSAFLLYTGFYFIRIADEDVQFILFFLFSIDIIAGIIFFGYCLYILRNMIRKRMKRLKRAVSKTIVSNFSKFRKNTSLYRQTFRRSIRRLPNEAHLLDLGKNPNISNISFSPKSGLGLTPGDASPSRFKMFTPKSTEVQSTPVTPALLKTDPALTAVEDNHEIERMFSPKSRTLIVGSERNLLSILQTKEHITDRKILCSPTNEKNLSFKSIKSIGELCLEIEEEIHQETPDTDEPKAPPRHQKKSISLRDDCQSNSNSGSFSDETLPYAGHIKRSQFYAKGKAGKSNLL